MVAPPSLSTEVHGAIKADNLVGANKDKVAVVTGAARGVGKACAEALARSGAHVALLDFDVERQAQTKSDCERHWVKVFAYGCDITSQEEVVKVFRQIAKDLGPVEILVNNAGRNFRRPFLMETFDQFWKGVETNLKGAMLCSYQVIHGMRDRGHGCIVNIASRAGTVTAPFAAAYSTGKSGLIRATSCWQTELEIDGFGDNIHLYALHPGGVKSGMILPIDDDVKAAYPQMAAIWASFHKTFRTDPFVTGNTVAFLAAGRGKALRGKYFDVEQDIEHVIAGGRESLEGLYDLKVEFLGGLANDGGTTPALIERKD